MSKKFSKNGTKDLKQTRLYPPPEALLNFESSSYSSFDPKVKKFKEIKMVVCMKLPFTFAKNSWFTKYCKYLNPKYVLTLQNSGRGIVIKDYNIFLSTIVNLFESHKGFLLIFVQHLGYIGICTHFIDDHWILQK